MSYLSIEFGLFFISFLALYWGLNAFPKIQNWLLLISSYLIVFSYSWQFATILFVYTCIIYLFSILISSSKHAKTWLIIAIIVAIANLAVFKYFDFFRHELQTLLNYLNIPILIPLVSVLIPIGISFYTFHSVSYLVSIRKREIAVANFWDFALFLSFFPSIIAGPINRAKDFLPQITVNQPRQIIEPYRALMLIVVSIIKVYCLGELINENWVKPIFANPFEFNSLDLFVGLYAYAIQIYLNFSGYTDLVTGISLLLGFRLPKNFNFPYLSLNLRQFWERWHISLSSWIRDYIYIPLGGNRKGFIRTQINVLLAMLLSGLWHGSGLNFVIWGACHGIGIVVLNVGDRYLGREYLIKRFSSIARLITWHYVCFTWLFFYCVTVSDAMDYLTALTHNFAITSQYWQAFLIIIVIYIIYPKCKHLPVLFTTLLIRLNKLFLPFIFIFILWLAIYFAPSGMPNFIYANF